MTQQTLFTVPQTEYTSDDYYTPKWLFDALKLTFDLDVACPPEGPLHTPTKAFYTQKDDGLAQPWYGLVFMNPPYSKPKPWVQKWTEHGNGIAVLPMAKSAWFLDLWNNPNVAIVNIHDPNKVGLAFHRAQKLEQIFMPVVALAIGQQSTDALKNSNLGRVR